MIIHVTTQDIEAANHKALNNPISRAIQRVTQQQWIVFDGHTAHELTPPYQSLPLPELVLQHWQRYHEAGVMEPFDFEFSLDTPYISDALAGDALPHPDNVTQPESHLAIQLSLTPEPMPQLPSSADHGAPPGSPPSTTGAQLLSRAAAALAQPPRQVKDRRGQDRRRDERRRYQERRRGSRVRTIT